VPLKFPAEFKITNIPQKIQNVGALFWLKKLSAFSIYEKAEKTFAPQRHRGHREDR
jgi:hypothetical protein